MTTTIKPIETRYAGCRFRSRLEARWAVFFDTLGVKWEYESEGIEIPLGKRYGNSASRYLPDFWLPDLKTFVEVKGSDEQVTDQQKQTISCAIDYQATPLSKGLLLLGPVPDPTKSSYIVHHFLSWEKGVELSGVEWGVGLDGPRLYDVRSVGFLLAPYDNATAPNFPETASWQADCIRVEFLSRGKWKTLRPPILAAYTAARSARFEHGERG
jgi:hypothetical protein